jgi:hypothetical protein
MIRWLLAICACFMLATQVSANSLQLGVQGGTSIPNLRDNGDNELSGGWSTRVAPAFGVFADYGMAQHFAVRTELNYVSQGGKRNGMQPIPLDPTMFGAPPGTLLYANFDNVAKLDYLEIPVLAEWSFGETSPFSAMVGPYVGFLLSAKTETSGESVIYADKAGTHPVAPSRDGTATTDNKSDLNTFNWGFQAGASASHALGKGRASLSVRGELGLANIQKDTAANGKNTTGTLLILLGYAFPVRER